MNFFGSIKNYFVQSFVELRKVSWPKRSEAIYLTIIVICSVIVSMLIVAGLDWVLTKVVNIFIE